MRGLMPARVLAMAAFGFMGNQAGSSWNPPSKGPSSFRGGRSRPLLRIKADGDKLAKLAKRHACGVPNPSRMITKYDFHTKQWKIGLLVA